MSSSRGRAPLNSPTSLSAATTPAILVAGAAALLALGEWPYPYFQVVRLVVFGAAVWAAYDFGRVGRGVVAVAFALVALIFNPLFPLRLHRTQWMPLDVIAACVFLGLAVYARPLRIALPKRKPASAVSEAQVVSKSRFGEFGRAPEDAEKATFFQWFRLTRAEDEPTPPGTYRYRPSGPTFHDLATVDIAMGANTIVRMTLELERNFVDDPRNGAFAADIASSFLESATSGADRAGLGGLIAALRRVMLERPTVIVRADQPIPPGSPGQHAGALDVYRGTRDHYDLTLAQSTMRFDNEVLGGKRFLRITVQLIIAGDSS